MPPRKKRSNGKSAPKRCKVPECNELVPPRRQYCTWHAVSYSLIDSSNRAMSRGDYRSGIVAGITGTLLDAGLQYVATNPQARQIKQQYEDVFAGAFQGGSPPPPRPPSKDEEVQRAFDTIGVDKKTATEKQIREMQRRLAMIYHSDQGGDAAAENKLKEINAAAEVCLSYVQKNH